MSEYEQGSGICSRALNNISETGILLGESPSGKAKLLKNELAEIILKAVRNNRSYLMEHESKEILEGIGIATTGFLMARSEKEALAISERMGFPVVLKILSPDVIHKTDGGGVKLNLLSAADVRQAYREITGAFRSQRIEGVAVQRMAKPGIEVIVGVTRDPSFGPLIMFGLGGVFVEVMRDVSFRVLPITEKDAEQMIEDVRGSAILKGYRGKAVDLASLRQLLMKISQLVIENPEIKEIDLNPLFLYDDGYVTVDARMFVGEPEQNCNAQAKEAENLKNFFCPQSIAVVGASDAKGKLGYNVFWNLKNHNFSGDLYPINPGKDSIMGIKAYKSILDVQDNVDLAIIIVPAKGVEAAIAECCKKGVRFVVIETAGFAESGAEGKKAQQRIQETIRRHGCRVLGPNCSGVINTHHNMVQSIGLLGDLRKGHIGMVAQAGVYAAGILTGLSKILDFGIVATIGNKMDLNETDILGYLSEDNHISVIGMYMEDICSGKSFIDVASRTALRKPVIVLKSGRTEAGKKAVSSHTASLAGNDEVNRAAFKQSGVIRARDNDHLFALMNAFSKQPIPKGNGTLVITYTGSMGVAATDALYLSNMRLASLEPHFQQQLKETLPDYANIGNPIDCSFTMTPEQVKRLIEIGVENDDVQSFLVVIQGEMLGSFVDVMKNIDYKGKPVVCSVACKEFMIENVIKMEQAGIPVYSTAEMAAEVLGQMYHYGVRRNSAIADSIGRNLIKETLFINGLSVRLRLINAQDTGLWTDFVNSCSQETVWLRFLSTFVPSPERAERFCNINLSEEIALVAEADTLDQRKFLGIGRLIKNELCEGEADYALMISDPWQNKKLGYVMAEQLIELARKEGYKILRTETVQENLPIIRICQGNAFQIYSRDKNMLSMSLNLS